MIFVTAPFGGMSVMSSPAPTTLLEAVRQAIRVRHYSFRTERSYVHWIRRFVVFHGRRHPRELGAEAVSSFLSSLANARHVAAATQNQALAALLFRPLARRQRALQQGADPDHLRNHDAAEAPQRNAHACIGSGRRRQPPHQLVGGGVHRR